MERPEMVFVCLLGLRFRMQTYASEHISNYGSIVNFSSINQFFKSMQVN